MTHERNHERTVGKENHSKKYEDPPSHAVISMRRNIERKREKVQKSTVGGY